MLWEFFASLEIFFLSAGLSDTLHDTTFLSTSEDEICWAAPARDDVKMLTKNNQK